MEDNQRLVDNNESAILKVKDFSGLYDIRPFQESDRAFVMATFLRGLYYGDSWFSKIPKDTFMHNYKQILSLMLSSGKWFVNVACLPEDDTIIIGYSIISSDYRAISWVYVKEKWRRKGIATSLLPKIPLAVTHLTKLGEQLLPKLQTAEFNPFYTPNP